MPTATDTAALQLLAQSFDPEAAGAAPQAPPRRLLGLAEYVAGAVVRRYLSRSHIAHVSNERAAVNALRLLQASHSRGRLQKSLQGICRVGVLCSVCRLAAQDRALSPNTASSLVSVKSRLPADVGPQAMLTQPGLCGLDATAHLLRPLLSTLLGVMCPAGGEAPSPGVKEALFR